MLETQPALPDPAAWRGWTLPAGVRGKANPKSSTGRLDVFTRVITDRSYRFDEIAPGLPRAGCTSRWCPLSFAVRVAQDLSLNQLRLRRGDARVTDDEIVAPATAEQPLLFRRRRPGAGRGRWPWPTASS